MGFCGCSLFGSTVAAVVLGMVESIFGLSWNILVIIVMSQSSNNVTTLSENSTLSPFFLDDGISTTTSTTTDDYDFPELSIHELWNTLFTNIQSEDAARKHLFEIVVTALVLNSFWLITTLALAVGNAEKCRGMLKPWIGTTIIITITDIAATIYFIFEAVKSGEPLEDETCFFTNIYVFYAVMFSRGVVVWIINIVLCVFVSQRIQQIAVKKDKRMPFNSSNYNMMGYTMQPPYDSYETGSSRTSKNYRPPNTPPPDYQGPDGRKRRPSLTSEPETVTLPLSMPSSRASLQRPLSAGSYLHDDRVELQHRASCAAETVLHAYENRGLVLETEGWMGIPRPSLKTHNH